MSARRRETRGGLEILSAGKGGTRREHPILESKAVQGLKMFTGDKVDFRTWLDRLVNVLAQVRTGSRKMLKVMMEYVDKDLGGPMMFEEWFRDTTECGELKKEGFRFDQFAEDLYSVLMDRTEGDAALRIRGCQPGQGVRAFLGLYKWYMGTSGQAIADRMRRLMAPSTPKSEAEIADHLEKWAESARVLETMKEEFKLPDGFKVTALERIMEVGQAKLHFESLKTQDLEFEELLQKCRDYAMRRRLEHGHRNKADDMDIDNVDEHYGEGWNYGHPMNMGGGFTNHGHWHDVGQNRTRQGS